MIDFPNEKLAVQGVVGPFSLEDLLLGAKKANRVAPLQVLRADRIVGSDHLQAAAFHANRAFDEGRNHADNLEVEFTRFASGERQIRKAIEKMGVPDGHDAAVVCSFGDKRHDALEYFVDWLGLQTSDSVIEGNLQKLQEFGITDTQIEATSPAARLGLVLEAVAAVNLMRK